METFYPSPQDGLLDADAENMMNYQAWKDQQQLQKSEVKTRFTVWRSHQYRRMSEHQQYKMAQEQQTESLKERLERRLSAACDCDTCRTQERRRASIDISPSMKMVDTELARAKTSN